MREKEKIWIKSRIKEYYENAKLNIKHIHKREFGIGDWNKKIEARHFSFNSIEELRGFLIEKAPLYVSYSTSLYKHPGAKPMEAKVREGVELTFDLDGEDSSMESLNKIKEELIKLLEVLKSDFGIKEYIINFSGNRGFHLHILDGEFMHLSSYGRKKLIEYLKGNFDYNRLFDLNEGVLRGPKLSDKGFRGRFARTIKEMVERNPRIFGRVKDPERWIKAVEEGNYSLIPLRDNKRILEKMKNVAEHMKIKSIDVDAGVTYDISKLIRMPDSIHGSTGMVACTIKEEELKDFNPYEKALPFKDETSIVYAKSIKVIENGKAIIKKKGTKEKVNKSIAIYMILKEMAYLP